MKLCLTLAITTIALLGICWLLANDIIRVRLDVLPPFVQITEGWHGAYIEGGM